MLKDAVFEPPLDDLALAPRVGVPEPAHAEVSFEACDSPRDGALRHDASDAEMPRALRPPTPPRHNWGHLALDRANPYKQHWNQTTRGGGQDCVWR
eukprot:3747563-Pyramimonas_sp.AAC.1